MQIHFQRAFCITVQPTGEHTTVDVLSTLWTRQVVHSVQAQKTVRRYVHGTITHTHIHRRLTHLVLHRLDKL